MYIYCQRIWYNRCFAQHMHSFHVLHGVLPKKRRIQSKSRQQYDKKNGEEMKHTLNLQETLWPILFFGPKMTFSSHPSHLLWVTCFFWDFPLEIEFCWASRTRSRNLVCFCLMVSNSLDKWFRVAWVGGSQATGSFGWKEVNHRNQPWKIRKETSDEGFVSVTPPKLIVEIQWFVIYSQIHLTINVVSF